MAKCVSISSVAVLVQNGHCFADNKLHGEKPTAFHEACADDSPRRGCTATGLRFIYIKAQKNDLPSSLRGDDGQARRTKRLRLSESNAGHSRAKQNATFVALVEMTASKAEKALAFFRRAQMTAHAEVA